MALVWFLSGLILGGAVTLVFMCALQIGRVNEYESENRRLRRELARARGIIR